MALCGDDDLTLNLGHGRGQARQEMQELLRAESPLPGSLREESHPPLRSSSSSHRQHSGSGSGSPTRGGAPRGVVPLLREEILLDDDNAVMVLVLPREQSMGGTVNPRQLIQDPQEDWQRIFVNRHLVGTQGQEPPEGDLPWPPEEDLPGSMPLLAGPVSAAVYQSLVRDKVLELLMATGLEIETFQSVHGNEAFVKIWLDPHGEVIRTLAKRFRYRMPWRGSTYEDAEPEGDFEGGEPMRNVYGLPVPGYVEFDPSIEHLLEDFQRIDVIRLLHMCLHERLDLNEMARQNVMVRHFPATSHAELQRLHVNWGSLCHFWIPPMVGDDEDVRNFFGESTAFFFRFFRFYIHFLFPLSILGLVCALRRVFWDHDKEKQRLVQIAFAYAVVVWASVFTSLFHRSSAYAKQRWGMDESSFSLERPDYDPSIEGSWRSWWNRVFVKVAIVAFCVAFVGVIGASETIKKFARRRGDNTLEVYSAYITVFMIKGVSWVWVRFCPMLVKLRNHRTQAAYNESMAVAVSMVKVFVSLWPFIYLAFLKRGFEPTCGLDSDASLEHAVGRLYGSSGRWPEGISLAPFVRLLDGKVLPANGTDLDWLTPFATSHDGKRCVEGCYPVSCQTFDTRVTCRTNCEVQLDSGLMTFYFVHVATTLLFLVIPILLTRYEVQQDRAKVVKREQEGAEGALRREYSLLQFQAKCSQIASYEYYSWGGSEVEDYTELAISFALLTCFGIALPVMSVCALMMHMLEYRFLAFRMTSVTCRPMPETADGIGIWARIFGRIGEVAVAINVGMAIFDMVPMRDWPLVYQLGGFILLEKLFFLAQKIVKAVIPFKPWDVARIDAFNTRYTNQVLRTFDHRTSPTSQSAVLAKCRSSRAMSRHRESLSIGPSAVKDWMTADIGAPPL